MGLERNLGLATKEASRWAAVTRARGVDSRTLVMSFTSLSRAIDGAREGTESSVEVFDKLGISQKQLRATQGDFSKQVGLVAQAFGDAEGSATRQAAAQKLLGRGYRDILPLFTEGSKGLQEQLKWADEFGATMGKGTVDAMSDFTTAQRRGRVAIMGLQIAFAKFATPAITEAIEGLGNLAAVLNSPDLTKAEKLARLREEFGRLQDRVIAIISDLVPIVAQSAGEIGVELAKGIGKGFLQTGILGKAAIAGFFVSMFGGPRAIIAGGAAVSSLFQAGFAGAGAMKSAFVSTTWLAQSFGRGPVMARIAGAGAALGQVGALGFVKAFARFLPPALAAISLLEIVADVVTGDMKSAGIKAGGALVGGIAGFLVGGPVGAMIGVGLGTLGADLGRKLIEGFGGGAEREMVSVADRIAASSERIAAASVREDSAYERLARASDYATKARQRQRAATDRVRQAEAQLAEARRRFGPNSEQAISAERRLARAKDGVVAATRRVQAASRLEGAERNAAKAVAESSVRIVKTEIRQLRRREQAITDTINKRARQGASDEEIARLGRRQVRINVQAEKAQRRLNEIYGRASREIGPKFAGSLRNISGFAASVGRSLRQLEKPTVLYARNAQDSFRRVEGYFGDWAQSLRRKSRGVNSNMRSMPKVQTSATDRMIEDLRNKIGVIGDLGSPQLNRRGGGRITGSTKTVVAAVSPGELISYGNHEIIVPGKPEPRDSVIMNLPVGAKVFTHDGQMRMAMGATPAQALRDQAPHFAAGGIVRPTISGGSPMANKAANKGVGVIHSRAQKKYENNMVTDLLGAVRLASRFGLSVSSGYRAGDDGYHGINRARDFVGSASQMYDFAKFIGTRFGARLLELIYSPLGWSIKNGAKTAPYAVADHYDHVHVALRKGGKVGNINRIFPESNSAYGNWGGPTLPSYVVAALAQAAGMPGKTMEQVTRGESGAHKKNSARPGATGIDPGGTKGHGLWMITSGFNEDLAAKAGGWRKMLNPVVNAWAAAQIYRRQGLGAWYGTGSVTGDGLNYTGKYDIKNALGGLSFQGALYRATNGRLGKKPKSIPKIKKGARRLDRQTDRLAANAGPGARRALAKADRLAAQAMAAADRGEVTKAQNLMKQARAIVARVSGRQGGNDGNENGDENKPPPNTPATGISPQIKKLVRQALGKGVSRDTKDSLLSSALSIAQATETTEDDEFVLEAQRRLEQGRLSQAEKALAEANRMLAKPNLTKKQRQKWQRQRNNALQALGSAQSEIVSINSQLNDLGSGGDSEVDLAEAMKELAEAIQEQNRLQSSVQATSSREALRMLSDVISGQIVGKRTPVGQTPIGVRY